MFLLIAVLIVGKTNEVFKIMREIYMDNAATTQLDSKVLRKMLLYLKREYGNPSSMHDKGIIAKNAISSARKKTADILNCKPEEIIFTGSGTESDNLAIFGYARKNKHKGNHIITTKIEHHAVLDCFKMLKKEGFKVTFLDVDKDGFVDLEQLKNSITSKTILVSIIYANNEIGTVQDIPKIAEICHKKQAVLHTDACQAANYLEIDVKKLGVDMMTLNGSKIYGPKGVGVLFKKSDIEIEPIIFGGGQEKGLRSGTENVANIIGFAEALERVRRNLVKEVEKLTFLRDYMINELLKIPDSRLNGPRKNRLPNNVNISFLNIEGESAALLLNEEGIFISTGSACSSKDLDPSHVIMAIGCPAEVAHSSLRFSLGKDICRRDVDYVIKKTKKVVSHLRNMSPLHYKLQEQVKQRKDDDCTLIKEDFE